jgi:hypothetical protein
MYNKDEVITSKLKNNENKELEIKIDEKNDNISYKIKNLKEETRMKANEIIL